MNNSHEYGIEPLSLKVSKSRITVSKLTDNIDKKVNQNSVTPTSYGIPIIHGEYLSSVDHVRIFFQVLHKDLSCAEKVTVEDISTCFHKHKLTLEEFKAIIAESVIGKSIKFFRGGNLLSPDDELKNVDEIKIFFDVNFAIKKGQYVEPEVKSLMLQLEKAKKDNFDLAMRLEFVSGNCLKWEEKYRFLCDKLRNDSLMGNHSFFGSLDEEVATKAAREMQKVVPEGESEEKEEEKKEKEEEKMEKEEEKKEKEEEKKVNEEKEEKEEKVYEAVVEEATGILKMQLKPGWTCAVLYEIGKALLKHGESKKRFVDIRKDPTFASLSPNLTDGLVTKFGRFRKSIRNHNTVVIGTEFVKDEYMKMFKALDRVLDDISVCKSTGEERRTDFFNRLKNSLGSDAYLLDTEEFKAYTEIGAAKTGAAKTGAAKTVTFSSGPKPKTDSESVKFTVVETETDAIKSAPTETGTEGDIVQLVHIESGIAKGALSGAETGMGGDMVQLIESAKGALSDADANAIANTNANAIANTNANANANTNANANGESASGHGIMAITKKAEDFIDVVVEMGFPRIRVLEAYAACKGNEDETILSLIETKNV